ncbi:MAG: radical SAM protein [Candidatus Thermoplasmatota archaeon]
MNENETGSVAILPDNSDHECPQCVVFEMRVVLINPPSLFLNIPNAYPPTGLLYLGAALEAKGAEVEIVDLCDDPNWEQTVKGLGGNIFGVTCVTPNYNSAKKIINLLPEDSIKMIGGAHATALPQETFKDLKCHVIAGEGEEMIYDVAQDEVPKLWNCGLVDVNKYPIPARHLVDVRRYEPEMTGGKSTSIYTSRGCPYNCNFCFKITGSIIRYRNKDNVIAEIVDCRDNYGIKNFVFGDDNFLLNRKRVMGLVKELDCLDINFKCIGRSDLVDKEYLQFLFDHGCTEINYGVESGSQRILDLMNKRERVKDSKNAILWAKEVGLVVKAFFIVGFPGEDETSIQETKKFILETQPHKWLLSQFVPLPGSDVFKYPEKYGITWISQNWDDYVLVGRGGKGGITFETKDLNKERLIRMHDDLHNFLMDTLGDMGR